VLFNNNTKEIISITNILQHSRRQELLRETEMQPLKEEINALYSASDEWIIDVQEAEQDDCELVYVYSNK